MDEPKENLRFFENVKHHEGTKLLILTIIIGITIFLFLIKYFILPFFFKKGTDGFDRLFIEIKNHLHDIYTHKINIILFILLVALISTLMTFKDLNFKHLGMLLIITYISSIAVEAKLYLTGAMLNAVIIYIYLIILIKIEKKENNKNKKNKKNK